jgi:di/tricarboxylate transporter
VPTDAVEPRAAHPSQQLQAGDVLLIRTTPEEIVAIRQEPGVELHPVAQYGAETPHLEVEETADLLVQAVVAPRSELEQQTLGEVDFRQRYGALVVGFWRRDGWLQQELARIQLRAGDVLVLQGDQEALKRVANDPAFLMLIPFQGEARLRRKAWLAGTIMLATVAVAAFNILTIEMAAVAGAVAMVLSGCLTAGQAYRAIDTRIFVFIAGAMPLGAAMQRSGASALLAGWLQTAVGNWEPIFILLALFGVVAIPYVVTVAMAAVASFLTPIGHHGNLLIYGPGRYQFTDFVWVGAPLTVLVALIVAYLAPLLWPK